jgi:hypothetical protein
MNQAKPVSMTVSSLPPPPPAALPIILPPQISIVIPLASMVASASAEWDVAKGKADEVVLKDTLTANMKAGHLRKISHGMLYHTYLFKNIHHIGRYYESNHVADNPHISNNNGDDML